MRYLRHISLAYTILATSLHVVGVYRQSRPLPFRNRKGGLAAWPSETPNEYTENTVTRDQAFPGRQPRLKCSDVSLDYVV